MDGIHRTNDYRGSGSAIGFAAGYRRIRNGETGIRGPGAPRTLHSGIEGGQQRNRMVQPPVTGSDSPADAGTAAKRNRAGDICRCRSVLVYMAACGTGDTAPWTERNRQMSPARFLFAAVPASAGE